MSGPMEAVAMSGGVDSSVAALLRARTGARVVGITMKLWDPVCSAGEAKACCTADHAADALRVCQRLSIPHYVLDLRDEFRRSVVDPFLESYLAGRTPNPCVDCNSSIKWGALRDRADELGCGFLATGHYARIVDSGSGPELRRGMDAAKDQSYFLWGIPKEQLGRTVFPLGELDKDRVRGLAASEGLPTAEKRESQDICFVPGGDYRELVRSERPGSPLLRPGPVIGPDGRELGEHHGLASYTIGQRRGVGVSWREPLYVVGIDSRRNELRLGASGELMVDRLTIAETNWLVDDPWSVEGLEVQVRYRSAPHPCRLQLDPDGAIHVHLDSPILSPAPGQSMVLYRGDRVVGGGILSESRRIV